jgi:Helix-turn-helix
LVRLLVAPTPPIPEAPLQGVLPEEHAQPPCRGCVLEDQKSSEGIDSGVAPCDNLCTMSTKPTSPITDVLRRAIVQSGTSYKALSRETGVARASIQRFVDGRQSIRLDMADRLAEFFRLSLRTESSTSREVDR